MKIDRRGFLSFVAGGAAGTALSPLPWKLMDDFSIWSQVWPWVPVPKGGESTYANTICSLCPGGCGITVRKVDNRAVKIEGLKGHPVSDGGVCGLGLSGLQLLYGPTRVKSPMRRIGSRGSGKWQKISWDEAISIVAGELVSMRDAGAAHKVACVSGHHRGTVSALMQRFFQAYGSPNFIRLPAGDDINELVLKILCGSDAIIDFDFENSDFILSFGSGLTDGWTSPVRMIRANSKWRDDKIEVVQVEPTLSNTAAKATQWVSANPGTEADLAFGMATFMITHGLYDMEFVAKRTVGFSEWQEVLKAKYSLNSVSRTTGVDVETIVDLSKSFAGATSPVALCGRGNGVSPSSFRDYASVHVLNILKGNINKRGGVLLCKQFDYVEWPSVCIDEVAKIGSDFGITAGKKATGYSGSERLLNNLITDLESDKISLKALFVAGSNPCYSLPNATVIKKVLKRIPLLVSFSSFMDETASESDLIMPNHVYLERFEDVPVLTGHGKSIVEISEPVVSAQFNTRHLGETIINMAHAIGGAVAESFPWMNYEECLEASLGSRWDHTCDERLCVEDDVETEEVYNFTLVGTEIPSVKAEGNVNLFPFLLLPCDSLCLSSGYIASPPFLVKTVADTIVKGGTGFVDINPQTAEAVGLGEGDSAVLSTPKGEASVKIHLYEGVRPGVVMMLRGLGHTAYDGYIANKGVNVNDLIGHAEDPVLGHDAFWGIRAKLTKA